MLLKLIEDIPKQLPVSSALPALTLHPSKVLVHLQEVPTCEHMVSDPHLSDVVSVCCGQASYSVKRLDSHAHCM